MKGPWIGTAVVIAVTLGTSAPQARTSDGAVYTASNNPSGNQILMFDRNADGALTFVNAFNTGGTGSGNSLGNQGGIAQTTDGRFLLVVNAGSNDISVLETALTGLVVRDRKSSGGRRPISVTVSGRLVYVLNNGAAAGSVDTVVGFRLSRDGGLTQIAGSTRALSAASVGPAQVELSPSGESLVVTEKATNRIDIFAVDDNGLLGASNSIAAAGQTPFGFAFGKHDEFFVSEAFGGAADASAISSYQVTDAAAFAVVSASVPTTETAACWVTVAGDGRFLYTTNAGSGTVSGFSIRPDGTITRLDADGITGVTGGGVTDVTLSANGRYLYALRSGAGAISAFRVEEQGSLTFLGAFALPAGANGIVVR